MNFIAKKIHWIGIFLLVGFAAAAATMYFDVPGKAAKPKAATVDAAKFLCPMHPEVVSAKPGSCPKCGMALVPAAELSKGEAGHAGCGSTGETEAHGCCGSKETTAELTLPPGHPPIPGYTVQSGCNHAAQPELESK